MTQPTVEDGTRHLSRQVVARVAPSWGARTMPPRSRSATRATPTPPPVTCGA